jgi:glycogen(starch) synthase
LASVLKPVDDTRMFEKIGATLLDSGEFEVTIVGYPTLGQSTRKGVECRPLKKFGRLSLNRLLAPWQVFQIINQVKPELIIINTPELLLVAFLNRILYGRKIIYDVLENYYYNIRFTPAFPKWMRFVLATFVRLAEVISRTFVSHYLLAEKGYEKELEFATPHTVIENKLPQEIASQYNIKNKGYSKLIFSGTLAPTTGVLEAIQLCKKLHELDASFTLTIVGYCSLPDFLHRIKSEIAACDFIKLIGGGSLVPHFEILQELGKSDFGIVIYSVNPSTESSIPTKLYEYLAIGLPVLIHHNEQSHQLVSRLNAGVILPKTIDYISLAKLLKSTPFHPLHDPSIFWETEAAKLKASLKIK